MGAVKIRKTIVAVGQVAGAAQAIYGLLHMTKSEHDETFCLWCKLS